MLRMNHITKQFPGVKSLDDVSITLERGEIRALVGENGAGKSTLIKILSGAYTLDQGEIWIDDERIESPNPALMIEKGVAVIYQEMMLLPHFTVAENIFHGRMPVNRFGKIDYKKMDQDAQALLDRLNLPVKATDCLLNLSVAKRQMVEIAKALSRNAKIVVLDEPTAVLAESELEGLFRLVHQLAGEGIGFIYISHRMKEIFELCTTVTIMRDGCLIENGNVEDYNIDLLINKMVGREVGNIYPKRSSKNGETILKVTDLCRKGVLDHVSLELHRGEILGLAGLAGAGRTETLRAIIAADPIDSGEIELYGKPVHFKNVRQALDSGLGIVPEERKTQGLLLKQNMIFNLTLPSLSQYMNKFGRISPAACLKETQKYIDELHIRPGNPKIVTNNMSGGNQQKVVVARWIASNCKILLIDEPTRGVDVGAKREIYEILNRLVESGLSILMVSSELPELIGVCDRIVVLNEGKLTGVLEKSEFSEELIMSYATKYRD